ncbi:MAG: FHA domain-containing protein [Myxococcales bacterium]|nr:FHA domain-containing protein [Myxococcales bacterium]
MFAIIVTEKGGQKRRLEFEESAVSVGRVQGNHVVLTRGNVSKEHCRITHLGDEFRIEDLGSTNGTYVNGRKITAVTPVTPADKIYVGEFILAVELIAADAVAGERPSVVPPPIPRPRLKAEAAAPPVPVPEATVLPRPSSVPPAPAVSLPRPSSVPQQPGASLPRPAATLPKPAAVAPPKPVAPPRPSGAAPMPPSAAPDDVPLIQADATPASTAKMPAVGAHHTHLLDYAAVEIKRIDRANLPCALEPATVGQLRIVLRSLIEDLARRDQLSSDDNPDEMLFQALLAIADWGPLNAWLADPALLGIRLCDDGAVHWQTAAGWQRADTDLPPEQVDTAIRSLAAGLQKTDVPGAPGLSRYRLENGALVTAQLSPTAAQRSALVLRHTAKASSWPQAVRDALDSALQKRQRLLVVGPAPQRLFVTTELLSLLPRDHTAICVEDMPLLGAQNDPARIALSPHQADGAAVCANAFGSLLDHAATLTPQWLVARSARWEDAPGILACATSHPGFIAELPATQVASLPAELSSGLLRCGIVATHDESATLLRAAFDCIVVADVAQDGTTNVPRILSAAQALP